jgi:hypothetical protein
MQNIILIMITKFSINRTFFSHKFSPYSSGWPRTQDPPALNSKVRGLQVCTTTSSPIFYIDGSISYILCLACATKYCVFEVHHDFVLINNLILVFKWHSIACTYYHRLFYAGTLLKKTMNISIQVFGLTNFHFSWVNST